jgi:hypothetical protein
MPMLTQLVISYNQLSGSLPIFTFNQVAVDSTGNPDLTSIDKVPEMAEDNKSGIWVAAVSFVVCFVISFYGDGIKNGWFTG